MPKTSRCPICEETFASKDSRWFPFCSHRCKVIDLGKWLSGDYAIPSRPSEGGELSSRDTEEDLH